MTQPPSNIAHLLTQAELRFAGRTAVVEAGSRRTYAEFGARVRALAGHLRRQAACDRRRVAILGPNRGAFLEAYFAAAACDAILVPLNVRLAPTELSWILADCGARTLIADAELEDLVRSVRGAAAGVEHVLWTGPAAAHVAREGEGLHEDVLRAPQGEPAAPGAGLEDVAQLYYTSGTTGRPKGVMLTHGNVLAHALAVCDELALDASDVWGHFAPLFHLADAWATFAITLVGGCHVCVPRFEAGEVLDTIERERVSLTNLVPTMLARLVHHPEAGERDLSSLRLMLSGGAPIAPQLVRRTMQTLGCEYAQTYGMTETSPYLTLGLLDEGQRTRSPAEQLALRAKTGRAFKAVELRVVDAQGRDVPADARSVGEILARGPTVTPGYWRRPEETAAALSPEGWLSTGDLATIDAEGFLDIVDRKKDVILSGGETIYSTEIEHRLAEHPAVLEAAVFGLPDAQWGERVCAAVVLHPGAEATPEELDAFCRRTLGAFKVPRQFEFLEELPRTGSGKITKAALRRAAR